MGSVPRKCWRDYIYSIWHRNALQSHGGETRCGWKRVRVGYFGWQEDSNKQEKMDGQFFFFCILASHPSPIQN